MKNEACIFQASKHINWIVLIVLNTVPWFEKMFVVFVPSALISWFYDWFAIDYQKESIVDVVGINYVRLKRTTDSAIK